MDGTQKLANLVTTRFCCSTKINDKCDDFDFDIVNFPFPRRPSYGIHISQLISLARVCSHVTDFNARN